MTAPEPPAGAPALRHWQMQIDGDRIGWLCLNRQGAGTNTLSRAVMTELETAVAFLEGQALRGLVVHSGKAKGFIAGADINEFPELGGDAEAYALTRRGQAVLARLEALPCPSVAVLNGFALGGGLELALACSYRLALAGTEPVFGLPEIQLGLHPGFGGTVRLPALVGARRGLDLILTGRSLRPAEARAAGLVDAVVGEEEWREAAGRQISQGVRRPPPGWVDRLLALDILRPLLARSVRRRAEHKAPPAHYPAPGAVVDLWEKYGGGASEAAYEAEARSFARLVGTPTSRNLVRVFFLQERLKKTAATSGAQRVHVVGAGVMGGDIAAWCALRGLEVTLQDREMRFIEPALARAGKLFARKTRSPQDLAAAVGRLRADPEGTGAATADVVIEAVFEDLAVKRGIFEHLALRLKPGAILASNTSSIPLEDLAATLPDPSRLIGLHFFNPVAKLPLIEVVAAEGSAPEAVATGVGLARRLGKLPLTCRSRPGFLVNRILAPYIAEALEMVREGIAPAEIDHAATDFGMPMGPLELADSVGLDVASHVARILAPVIGRPVAPELDELVSRRQLGLKSGRGFYTYRDGEPVRPALPFGTSAPAVQERLVLALLNEAATCLHEGIVTDADLVDAGVIFGTGFAPFRGGPLHYARQSGVADIEARLQTLADRLGPRFNPSPGWALVRQ